MNNIQGCTEYFSFNKSISTTSIYLFQTPVHVIWYPTPPRPYPTWIWMNNGYMRKNKSIKIRIYLNRYIYFIFETNICRLQNHICKYSKYRWKSGFFAGFKSKSDVDIRSAECNCDLSHITFETGYFHFKASLIFCWSHFWKVQITVVSATLQFMLHRKF